MFLSDRSKYALNPIEEEDALAEKLAASGKKIIKLNRGDPPVYFPTPPYILNAYACKLCTVVYYLVVYLVAHEENSILISQ